MTSIEPTASSGKSIRYGIILAGGDGTRLRDFVRQRRNDDLPKQYNNFVGSRSMLEHTWDRAESVIPAPRLLVVIARHHLKFAEVRRQLALRPSQNVLVQPMNRETMPGILLPLLHVHQRHPDAIVALFPSDHFILEEERFMDHVEGAFQWVHANPFRLVLLGVEPDGPDADYGYIVPGRKLDPSLPESPREVEMFVEKPSRQAAGKIIAHGALWNTMVMVFACRTLLSIIQGARPDLYRAFEPVLDAIGTADELRIAEEVYRSLSPVNFSKAVLEALPLEYRRSLVVLPVRGVTWSDWGTSERLCRMIEWSDAGAFPRPAAASSRRRARALG